MVFYNEKIMIFRVRKIWLHVAILLLSSFLNVGKILIFWRGHSFLISRQVRIVVRNKYGNTKSLSRAAGL